MVCNALVAGGRLLGAEQQAMRPGRIACCSAIKHSVTSSWFSSLCLYNDALTNIHRAPVYFMSFYMHNWSKRYQFSGSCSSLLTFFLGGGGGGFPSLFFF